jgi:hypothetical protein
MKITLRLITLFASAGFMLASCEGPMGPAGKDGLAGIDANETCKQCHNSAGVDSVRTQFELSKHSYGEAAFGESGSTGCAPCHTSEGFKFVVATNKSTVFSIVPPATTYSNPYAASAAKDYGELRCSTCHVNLHTSYTAADFMPLTTTAAVPMTFFGGAKTIDLTQDGSKSNLCVKCHQPRPFTRSFGDKNIIDYSALVSSPTTVFFDGNNPNSTANVNTIKPSYRTHTHYGTVGAIFAGKGGVEFGTGYTNSQHTTVASCQDCHMAPLSGRAGGHTFFAKGNFNGCNVCHNDAAHNGPISSSTTTAYWAATRTEIKNLLNSLAAKLTIGGVDILNRNPVSSENYFVNIDYNFDGTVEDVLAGVNLWAGLTTNNYDGYLNIYDPSSNPLGANYNTTVFQNPAPSTSWNAAQTAFNLTLPKLVLTNAQFGAIINFQLCLREYSLGIHNTKYVRTLLTNSIAALI